MLVIELIELRVEDERFVVVALLVRVHVVHGEIVVLSRAFLQEEPTSLVCSRISHLASVGTEGATCVEFGDPLRSHSRTTAGASRIRCGP